MKIAVITNVPDENSPMFSSFIQFAKTEEYKVISSSRFKLNDLLNNLTTHHNHIRLQKYKLQFLFFLPALFILFRSLIYLFFDKTYINKKKIQFHTILPDLILTFKSSMNNIAINVSHFAFLFRTKPDFVVCCCVAACDAARWYQKIFNIKFAYGIYEVYPNHNKEHLHFIFNKYHRTLDEKIACLHCAFVISPADETFGRLLKLRYKIPNLSIVSLFFSHPVGQNFSNELTTLPIKLYYHGMMDRQRHIPEFIQALHQVKTENLHLYLRGKGPELQLIKDTISELKMHNIVKILDFLPQEELTLAAKDYDIGLSLVAFDSPNNRFLIGFKSTDYLCAGMCQFGPDSYILGKFLKSKKLGFTYKNASIGGFKDSINYLIENFELIDKYKANARKIALEKASFETNQQILINLISQNIKLLNS